MKVTLKQSLTEVKNGKIDGINVTVPFKKSVIPFLDKLTPDCKRSSISKYDL